MACGYHTPARPAFTSAASTSAIGSRAWRGEESREDKEDQKCFHRDPTNAFKVLPSQSHPVARRVQKETLSFDGMHVSDTGSNVYPDHIQPAIVPAGS